ncbi:hypothetical protein IMCC3317_00630 [Kordia antarctica]|uniref:Lipoprotein n=1 Tax=Kordia antarctica TaxID=1218801 RepID=A0A7L4ZDS8_9FLAO|nr:hypothetical protein [Kordia antarctica]QHI34720.1 hypothetical protein IMCC3317_00630 [Kordia antarctica]
MKAFFAVLLMCFVCFSCSKVKETTKSAIKEGGKIVGESVGEFGKGLSEGVEKSFKINISASEEITNKGVSFGKITLSNSVGGSDNILNVYLIFDQDFDETLSLKVFDNENLEMGRTSTFVSAKKGEADFFEFQFNKKTNIDSDSMIFME